MVGIKVVKHATQTPEFPGVDVQANLSKDQTVQCSVEKKKNTIKALI